MAALVRRVWRISRTEAIPWKNHPARIRNIFLSPRPNFAIQTAADLLGFTLRELKREIEDEAIVAVWTVIGERMTGEELVAVAMQKWDQATNEAAPGGRGARPPRGDPAGGVARAGHAVSEGCCGSWRECLGCRWRCGGRGAA
jgi:hypothetical protein